MLYDSYQKRMRKVAKVRNFVKKRRIPIIIISAIILLTIIAFMSTKGAATNIEFESTSPLTTDDNGNIVIEYGGEISAGSKALFASSHVEYLVNGEWTEIAPSKPGEYTVRVVSENSFGGERTGKEQTVIISSKKSDVTIKDVVVEYGALPTIDDINIDLVEGDELVDATFVRKGFNQNDCGRAVFSLESIKVIEASSGKDVTNDYYDFNFVDKELKLSPTKVNLDIKDLAKVFNDTEITEADYNITKGEIVDDGTILKLTYDGSKIGSQSSDATIKVVLDGVDITKLYDFNINVNRRDITILSGSIEKDFNGSELSYAEFEIIEGALAPNHKVLVSNSSKYINCGEYANIQDYIIVDTENNNADVTDKYNISKNMGIIVIKKCDFDIELANLSFEYDGLSHSTKEFTLKNNSFGDEYEIVIETEGEIKNVGMVEVKVTSWHVLLNGNNVDENFNPNIINGSITITKKALKLIADDKDIIYGSEAPAFSLTADGFVEGEDVSSLEGIAAFACAYENSATSDKRNVGAYDITLSGYTSSNYEIEYVKGSLNVAKKKVTISANNKEITYGSTTPTFDLTANGFEYEEDEVKLALNVIYTCSYEAVTDSDNRHVGHYDINIDGLTNDNYEITYEKGDLNVLKKSITVTADNKEIIYGDASPDFTVSASGFEYEESLEILNIEATFICSYENSKDSLNRVVGTYVITPSNVECDDYVATYVDGSLNVTKKVVRVSANDATIIYGQDAINNGISYNLADFVYEETNEDVNEDNLLITYSYNKDVKDLRKVDTYTISASGLESANYEFEYTDGSLNVTKKELVFTIADKETVYGNAAPEFSLTDTGYEYEESIEDLDGTLEYICTYEAVAESTNRHAGTYDIDISGLSSDNYTLIVIKGSLNVAKKALTITADDKETVYGSVAPNFSLTDTGYAYVEDLSYLSGSANYTCAYEALAESDNRHAGTYDIEVDGFTSDDYEIEFVKGSLNVTKKALTITADDKETVYGSATPEFSLTDTGYAYEEDLSYLSGSANYTCAYEALAESDNRHVGTYDIEVDGFTSDDYEIEFVKGSLNVTKKALTITADDKETVYGSAAPEFSLTDTGYAYVEDLSYLSGSANYTCAYEALAESDNRHVGTYDITVTGFASDDYEIEFVEGSLNVIKKALTITADDKETVYGSVAPSFTLTDTGYAYEEDLSYLSGSANYTCAYEAVADSDNRHVGTYDIIVTGFTSDDYEIEFVKGSLNVTKKALTITADDKETVYGSAAPAFSLTDNGYAYEENLSYLSGSANYTCSYEAVADSDNRHVGTYDIEIDGYTSDDYEIEFIKGSLSVTPKALTITVDDKETVYGSVAPEFSVSGDGYVYGETLEDLDNTNVEYECSYSATKDDVNRHAGQYIITVTGFASDDYAINYVNAYLTVLKKDLTITADNKEIVYGDPTPSFTFTDEGYEYEEDASYLEGSVEYGCIYTQSKLSDNRHVGTYTITIGGLSSSDYEISYEEGELSVIKKTVRITVNDSTITYGDDLVLNGFVYNEEDFVYDEDSSLVDESELVLTTIYNSADEDNRGAGDYDIIASGLSARDYDFDYTKGTLHVLKKALNITADDKETVYGSAAPDFSVTSTGYVYGEDISCLSGELAFTCSYESISDSDNRHAGAYDIIASGLSSNNYDITYTKGILNVAKKDLNIKVDDKETIYGSAAPIFTHTDTGYAYEENVEALSGEIAYTCSYEAVKGSDKRHVGTYDITATGLTSDDYNITFTKGSLNVLPKALNIKADNKETVYGSIAPSFTVTGDGFVYDETLSDLDDSLVAYTCAYEALAESVNRHAGSYDIYVSGYSALDYDIAYTKGTLSVAKKALVIKALDKETVYGSIAPSFTYTDSGYVYEENVSYLSGEITYTCSYEAVKDSDNRHAGSYDIIPSGFESDDYAIDYQKGTLSVAKKDLSIYALDKDVVYGTIVTPNMLEYDYSGFVYEEDESYLSGDLVLVTTYDTSVYALRSVGTYPINVSGYTSTDYNITYNSGELNVSAKPFEITIDDIEITYGDSAPTYTYTLDEFAFEEDENYFGGTNELACSYEAIYNSANRHVGTYDIVATSEYTSTNYAITYVDGTLTVLAKDLTVKADDKATNYGNGAPAFTFTDSGYVYGENISVLSGQVIYSCIYEAVADSDNRHGGTYDIDISSSTLANADYSINYVKGTLTVNKIDLTITALDHEIVYGEDAANNGYVINDAMFIYNDSEADLDGEIEYSYTYDTSSAETRKVGSYTISISGYTSTDYNITYVDATLTVSKKDLLVVADDKETIYGLAAPDFSVSSEDFAFDDDFDSLSGSIEYTCSYNLADDNYNSANTYTIEVTGYSSTNYNISYQEGSLIVHKRPIKLHSDGDSKVYDGLPLSNENVTICEDTLYNLLDGHVLSISGVPSIVKAISRLNKMELVITSEDGLTDYTANYDLDTYYSAEYLEILRRNIRITSATDEKDYDRTPLTNHNYTIELLNDLGEVIEGDGIVDCDIETVVITGTITNVRYVDGEVAGRTNTISSVTINNKDTDEDVTSNYYIYFVEGTLTINPRGIVIETGSSEDKIYDDEYVQVEEYSITFGNLPEGYRLEVTDFPRVKDADTYFNIPTITIYDENDDVVDLDLFEITPNWGKIVIQPIIINLKSESADQPYDGTPLRAADYGKVFGAPENKDILAKHKLDATVVGEAVDIGVHYNTINARILDLEDNPIRREDNNELAYTIIYTRDNHSNVRPNNYLIYLDEGELSIQDTYVRVDYNNTYYPPGDFRSSKVYDGTPFTFDKVQYNLYNYVDSRIVDFDQVVKLKIVLHDGIEFASDVGSHILAKEDYDAYIVDVNDNILDYDVRYYDLPYRIYADHELTIVGAARGYSYDGMPHKAEDSEFEYFGYLEEGHTIEVHYTETRSELGTTYADFEYDIYDAGHNIVTNLYTINIVKAEVSINTRMLNFVFEDITHVYDGTYVSANMENVTTITGLLSGHRVESVLMENSGIKDCAYLNDELVPTLLRVYSFVVLDEDDNDVTQYYHILYNCGANITITPRDITFTSDNVSKVYDGDALTGNASQVHYVDGLVDGD